MTPHSWSHLACRCRSSGNSQSSERAAHPGLALPPFDALDCRWRSPPRPGVLLPNRDYRTRSFFCFRVSGGTLFDSVFVSFAIFFLSLLTYWRGTTRSRFTTYSLQRGQTACFEAAATKLMIDRTGARLYHGQERANVDSAITRDAIAVQFLPQAGPAPQVVPGPHDAPRTSRTLIEQRWSTSR